MLRDTRSNCDSRRVPAALVASSSWMLTSQTSRGSVRTTSICGVWMDEPSELGFKKAKFTVAGKDVEMEVSGFD